MRKPEIINTKQINETNLLLRAKAARTMGAGAREEEQPLLEEWRVGI